MSLETKRISAAVDARASDPTFLPMGAAGVRLHGAGDARMRLESLQVQLARLAVERQQLRGETSASREALEANWLEIGGSQREFASRLIKRDSRRAAHGERLRPVTYVGGGASIGSHAVVEQSVVLANPKATAGAVARSSIFAPEAVPAA